MDDDFVPMGTPARMTAEDMVRRAILDFLDEMHPGARTRIAERAHTWLSNAEGEISTDTGFFERAHSAIDLIVLPTID